MATENASTPRVPSSEVTFSLEESAVANPLPNLLRIRESIAARLMAKTNAAETRSGSVTDVGNAGCMGESGEKRGYAQVYAQVTTRDRVVFTAQRPPVLLPLLQMPPLPPAGRRTAPRK